MAKTCGVNSCAVDLHLCFCICKKQVFSWRSSYGLKRDIVPVSAVTLAAHHRYLLISKYRKKPSHSIMVHYQVV